jgi:hypothetical protein
MFLHRDISVKKILQIGPVAYYTGDRGPVARVGATDPIFEILHKQHIFLIFLFFNIEMKKNADIPA